MADVEYVGPVTDHRVIVDGFAGPFLGASPINGGKIDFTLDDRFALTLGIAEAEMIIPFLADAIAIGLGYTCHPRADWEGPRPLTRIKRWHSVSLGYDS